LQQSAPAPQQSALAAGAEQQAGQHGQQLPSQPGQPLSLQQEQPQHSPAGAGRLARASVPATSSTAAKATFANSFTSITSLQG
jgi:hypothetical protein